jgi:hypothetical protein
VELDGMLWIERVMYGFADTIVIGLDGRFIGLAARADQPRRAQYGQRAGRASQPSGL